MEPLSIDILNRKLKNAPQTDPKTECFEWTRDGVIAEPNWGEDKLFHFYNNKKNKFLVQDLDIRVDNSVYGSELKLVDSNHEIQTLFEA